MAPKCCCKGRAPAHPRRACVSFGFISGSASLVPAEARVHGILMEPGEIERLYAEPTVREYHPEAVTEVEDVPGRRIVLNLPMPAR
jgi:hypothetical protein